MSNSKSPISRPRKVLNHLGRVGIGALSLSFILASSSALAIDAADAAGDVVGSEGGKQVVGEALKIARGKPALSVAATITCLACMPAAGVTASPGLCVACGILIAKTFG